MRGDDVFGPARKANRVIVCLDGKPEIKLKFFLIYLVVDDSEDFPVASLMACCNPVRHPSLGASALIRQ
jgi:hypothetical protein